MLRPHIVIAGAGFGGVYVAKKLIRQVQKKKIDVTIINRTNYFLFTPLLHEVATGGLSPNSVSEPLREIFAKTGIRVIQGTIEKINSSARTVSIKGHSIVSTISYDYLVLATGAETNYYGVTGADTYTLPLKTLKDAVEIRSRAIDMFEQAILVKDPAHRRRLLSFAIVGGGATGVELAAELAEFISAMVKRYYRDTEGTDTDGSRPDDQSRCHPEDPSITLIHAGTELLEQFAPSLRLAAKRRLTHNKVILEIGIPVTAVSRDGLVLADGKSIRAGTVIWTAGVRPIIPVFEGMTPTLSGGRLAVDEYFRMLQNDRIFALGDVAAYINPDAQSGEGDAAAGRKPLPLLAQVAAAEAHVVAGNILAAISSRPLRRFYYRSKGSLVSVGQWFAVGEIFSLNIMGRLTWWIWRTVYLFKFASWAKRIQIIFEWTLAVFYPRDITKLN